MRLTRLLLVLPMALAFSISACKEVPPGDYDSSEVGKIKKVVPGVIISMRPVRLHNKNAEIGLSRTSASNSSADSFSNDSTVNRSHGFEYVIKLNSGSIISVVQAENIKLKIKQHILVIYGQHTRVVADNGSDDF
jgi:outer membrane lipoprotein SlyB